MIANAAFLAGLTTFVLAAWLAAELSFLAPRTRPPSPGPTARIS